MADEWEMAARVLQPPACRSLWGHKFEARYSYTYPHDVVPTKAPGGQFSGASIEYVETMLRAGQNKTYERDVCVRCGLVIPPSPPGAKDK